MTASAYRRSCLQLGVCQDRPTCTECTRLHSAGAQEQSAVRIERLINSRYQHTAFEPLNTRTAVEPEQPPLTRAAAVFWLVWFFAILAFTLVVASGRIG